MYAIAPRQTFLGRLFRSRNIRWQLLPYGMLTCADGRTVLFNRRYKPIWQRTGLGEAAVPADPEEWVPYVKQIWFNPDTLGEPSMVAAGISVGRAISVLAVLIGESVVMTIPVLNWIMFNLTKTSID